MVTSSLHDNGMVILVMMARQIPEYQTTAKLHLRRSVGIPICSNRICDHLGTTHKPSEILSSVRMSVGEAERVWATLMVAKRYRSLVFSRTRQAAIMSISVAGLEPAFVPTMPTRLLGLLWSTGGRVKRYRKIRLLYFRAGQSIG